ncbi:hypothetical protein [Streptomyces sp. NBC_01320]|uniref:hypothetical protein n=1 Tax=Streptomyces sp. NBC_01320 TaxID=2903824 RepID=UPI002E0E4AB5|nr:hypothetical protein OG395_57325 [Streptomyces sp. NBC_01320]
MTTPHSRYTPLLHGMLTQIGLALAGRAGARLAAAVGITAGKDTLQARRRTRTDTTTRRPSAGTSATVRR